MRHTSVGVSGILRHVTDPHIDNLDYFIIRRVVCKRLLDHPSRNRGIKECLYSFLCHPSLLSHVLLSHSNISPLLLLHKALVMSTRDIGNRKSIKRISTMSCFFVESPQFQCSSVGCKLFDGRRTFALWTLDFLSTRRGRNIFLRVLTIA